MFNKNKKLNNVHKEQEMTMPTTMEIKLLAVGGFNHGFRFSYGEVFG